MADMSSISAGIAWGVPVRPDLLGQSLEAFSEFLPTRNALRLCHRFGQGDQAHITKMPVELLCVVEDLVLEDIQTRKTDWTDNFTHFESRSFDWALDETAGDMCAKCQTNEDLTFCSDCQKLFDDALTKGMVDVVNDDPDWFWEECTAHHADWENLIDRTPKGNFAKYDQILRTYFGLESHFSTTRISTNQPDKWPKHENHIFHFPGEELRTTICYVTLPRRVTKIRSYSLSEMEAECGFSNVKATQSSLVQIPVLQRVKSKAKRFSHLLRTLKLQPYVHESQLTDSVSADVEGEVTVTEEDRTSHASTKTEADKDQKPGEYFIFADTGNADMYRGQ